MSCVKNRNYCHDCDRFYIDSIYPNRLRSLGHFVNVMKKLCCSCNTATTQKKLCCNNHNLTCCMSKLSVISDVDIKTDISDKQDCPRRKIANDNSVRYIPKSEQTKEKKFW